MEDNNNIINEVEEQPNNETTTVELDTANIEKEEQPVEETDNAKKTIKKFLRIVWNITLTLFFLVVLFETVMGILNMQRLNDDKDPIWYIKTEVKTAENKKHTSYDIGLYDIIKIEENGTKKVVLKPFFIKDEM